MRGSRIVVLGTAFMAVMAGTGGLVGAIAGVIMVLLGQAVMGLSAGVADLMPASVAFGSAAAISWSIFLIARQGITRSWQPSLVASVSPEHKQMS